MPVAAFLEDADGYIAIERSAVPVQTLNQRSAIEFAATRRPMRTNSQRVPGLLGADDDVIPKGDFYPETTGAGTSVLLEASKFGQAFPLAEEDLADEAGYINAIDQYGTAWANKHAVHLDNACLGVSGGPGVPETTVPFTSVYYAVRHNDTGYTANANYDSTTAAAMAADGDGLGLLNDFWALWEASSAYDEANGIVIAHPRFRGVMRSVKNSNGDPIFAQAATNISASLVGIPQRVTDTINGLPVLWSTGARVHATASATPAGNPLMIVGNRQNLLLGVRSGPEQKEETIPGKDVIELMFRSRRAFKPVDPSAMTVLELTA